MKRLSIRFLLYLLIDSDTESVRHLSCDFLPSALKSAATTLLVSGKFDIKEIDFSFFTCTIDFA